MGALRVGFSPRVGAPAQLGSGSQNTWIEGGDPAKLDTSILSWLGAYRGVEKDGEVVEETCSAQVLEGPRLVETEL